MVAFIIALAINLIGNNAWAAEDGIENVPQIRFSMLESGFRMNIDNVTADEIVDLRWNDVSIFEILSKQIQNGSVNYKIINDSIVLDIPLDGRHNGIFDKMPIFGLVLSSGNTIFVPVTFYDNSSKDLRSWQIVWNGIVYVWKWGRWVIARIIGKSIDDIVNSSKYLKTSKKGPKTTVQRTQSGGFRQANKDFDSLALSNIKDYGNGVRVGYKDGKTITVRGHSSYGGATLEIKNGNNIIKIRYD
jgi:hypothetical protein